MGGGGGEGRGEGGGGEGAPIRARSKSENSANFPHFIDAKRLLRRLGYFEHPAISNCKSLKCPPDWNVTRTFQPGLKCPPDILAQDKMSPGHSILRDMRDTRLGTRPTAS